MIFLMLRQQIRNNIKQLKTLCLSLSALVCSVFYRVSKQTQAPITEISMILRLSVYFLNYKQFIAYLKINISTYSAL